MFFIQPKRIAIAAIISLMLSGCGFYLQPTAEVPSYLKTLVFYSSDPYGFLAREIKKDLIDAGITLTKDTATGSIPNFRISHAELTKDTLSVYQDGKAAEYQLLLTVNAEVVIARQGIYPLSVRIFRSFFDNPSAALAKNTEQTVIQQEMYRQAAEQLVQKLKTIKLNRQTLE